MNCKPNDLAFIVSNRCQENIGVFVRVRQVVFSHPELGPFWSFDSATQPLKLAGFGEEEYHYIHAVETTTSNKAYLRDVDLCPIKSDPHKKKEMINDNLPVRERVRQKD